MVIQTNSPKYSHGSSCEDLPKYLSSSRSSSSRLEGDGATTGCLGENMFCPAYPLMRKSLCTSGWLNIVMWSGGAMVSSRYKFVGGWFESRNYG